MQWNLVVNGYSGSALYGQMIINGTIHMAAFNFELQINGFLPRPTNVTTIISFTTNGINETDINALPYSEQAQVAFSLTDTTMGFEWVIIDPPVRKSYCKLPAMSRLII